MGARDAFGPMGSLLKAPGLRSVRSGVGTTVSRADSPQCTFGVNDTTSFAPDMDEHEVLAYAASVEAQSEHPIAQGIVDKAGDSRYPVHDFKAITGRGAQGVVRNKEVKVVSPGYVEEHGLRYDSAKVERLRKGGNTVVFVMIDDEVKGAIALSDIVREESKATVVRLRQMGTRVMMVTGDNQEVAEAVARELGLDEYFAGVLPEKKVDKVKEIQGRRLVTAMVGDGINDAPALAQADVGIAIGAGTDVAAETADVILVRSNPMDVVSVVALSKATYRKMLQNLAWATGYNAIAIPPAAPLSIAIGRFCSSRSFSRYCCALCPSIRGSSVSTWSELSATSSSGTRVGVSDMVSSWCMERDHHAVSCESKREALLSGRSSPLSASEPVEPDARLSTPISVNGGHRCKYRLSSIGVLAALAGVGRFAGSRVSASEIDREPSLMSRVPTALTTASRSIHPSRTVPNHPTSSRSQPRTPRS